MNAKNEISQELHMYIMYISGYKCKHVLHVLCVYVRALNPLVSRVQK